VVGKKKTHLI